MNGVQHAVRYFDGANAEAAFLFSGNRVTVKLTALPLCADAAKQQVQTAMAKIKQKQFDYNAQEGRALEEPSGYVALHICPSRPCWTCMFALLFMLPSLIRRLMLEEITHFGRYQTSLMKRLLAWSPRFSRRTYDLWFMIISAVDIAYRIYQAASGDELPSQFNHAVHWTATVLICLADFACMLNQFLDGPSNVYLVAGVVQFWLFPLDLLLAAKNISFEKIYAALRTGLDKTNSQSYVFCFVAYALLYSAFFVTYSIAVVLFMAFFMVAWLGHAFPLCAKWYYKKRTESFLKQRAKQAKLARIVAR
ncbi:hypothetical protein AAVH_10283 [Aphelenchoides avenae]|nr:hypothetical protein AAVH_10283 [Aphelenchus avenae]